MNRYGFGGLIQYKSVIEPRCRDLTTLIEAVNKDTVKGSYVRLPAKHDCFIEALFMENGQIISDYEKVTPSSRLLSKGISTKNGAKFFDFDRLLTNGKTIPLNSWYYVPLTNRTGTYTSKEFPVRFSDLRGELIDVKIRMCLTLKTSNSEMLIKELGHGHTVKTDDLEQVLQDALSGLMPIAQEAARELKFDAFVANTGIYKSPMEPCFKNLKETYGLRVSHSYFYIDYDKDYFKYCQEKLSSSNRMRNELDSVKECFKDPVQAVQAMCVNKMAESDYRFTPTEVHSAIKNLK